MNQKLVAVFLAVIMVMSIFPFLFSGGSQQQNTSEENTNIKTHTFSSIGGEQVNVPLNSLADGMAVTPANATSVQYLNIEESKKSHLQYIIGNTTPLDELYGSKVVKSYSAVYNDSTWFELHKISPEIIAFSYYLSPETYKGYQLLLRQNSLYTVIGSPIIIGTLDSTEKVIDVLTGNNSTTSTFDDILKYAVDGAQLESAGILREGADQYYMAWKSDSMNYSRTTVYLNPTNPTMENITAYSAIGREKGLDYTINNYGNITEITITTNASGFFNLIQEPVM